MHEVIKSQILDLLLLWDMSDSDFKKYHKKICGDDLRKMDISEARLLLLKMELQHVVAECEVILYEITKNEV